jgi:basic membrane protein A
MKEKRKMSRKKFMLILGLLVILSMVFASCAPAAEQAAEEAPAEEAQEEAPAEEAVETPKDVKIAVIMGSTLDEPWYKTLLAAFDRFNEDNEYGLTISYDYSENLWGDDAERAMRAYAETGEYDIIWAHTSYSDQVKNMMDEYPELMFVYSGSGNVGLGDNAYFIFAHIHECAYLLGVAAGNMTETNVVGAVAGFPYEDVNDVLNGFIDGAKSVNPDIQTKITFIESWWDPPKAKEATYALIAAGADLVYAERFGPFEALQETGTYGFGQYEDQYEMAPDVVVTSTLLAWDPHVDYILSEWWGHVVDGKPWAGTIDPVWFGMKEGGCDIAPFHDDKASQEVQDAVMAARDSILNGEITVELNIEPPESD